MSRRATVSSSPSSALSAARPSGVIASPSPADVFACCWFTLLMLPYQGCAPRREGWLPRTRVGSVRRETWRRAARALASSSATWHDQEAVRDAANFLKSNPQALVLLVICLILGLG